MHISPRYSTVPCLPASATGCIFFPHLTPLACFLVPSAVYIFFRHSGTHRTNQDFLFGLTILNTQALFKSCHYSRERPCLGHYIVHSDWLIPRMPRQNALGNCLTADRYWWLLCARGIIGGSWMLRTSWRYPTWCLWFWLHWWLQFCRNGKTCLRKCT